MPKEIQRGVLVDAVIEAWERPTVALPMDSLIENIGSVQIEAMAARAVGAILDRLMEGS